MYSFPQLVTGPMKSCFFTYFLLKEVNPEAEGIFQLLHGYYLPRDYKMRIHRQLVSANKENSALQTLLLKYASLQNRFRTPLPRIFSPLSSTKASTATSRLVDSSQVGIRRGLFQAHARPRKRRGRMHLPSASYERNHNLVKLARGFLSTPSELLLTMLLSSASYCNIDETWVSDFVA